MATISLDLSASATWTMASDPILLGTVYSTEPETRIGFMAL